MPSIDVERALRAETASAERRIEELLTRLGPMSVEQILDERDEDQIPSTAFFRAVQHLLSMNKIRRTTDWRLERIG